MLGCNYTRMPYLRPPIQPDDLTPPPEDVRYDDPNLPKELLTQTDDVKKKAKEGIDPTKMGGNMGMGGPGGRN